MYWKLRTQAIMALLILGLARPTLAGLAEDQYAIAAHHYTNSRWEFAVEEFTEFLQKYPDHERAETVLFFLAESLVQLGKSEPAHDRFVEYLRGVRTASMRCRAGFGSARRSTWRTSMKRRAAQLEDFRTAHGDDPLCAYVYPVSGRNRPGDGPAGGGPSSFC